MRLAVIADIHGNLIALETVLADLADSGGWDHLWMLGDVAAFGARPVECIRRIKGLAEADGKKQSVRFVRGNTDRYLVTGVCLQVRQVEDQESLDIMRKNVATNNAAVLWGMNQLEYADYEVLKKLSGECDLHAPGYGYVIGYHGTPGDDEGAHITPTTPDEEAADALLDREGRLGIGAHIHVQMDRMLPGNWRAINVGSVGMSFNQPGYAQYGIFTFEANDVQVDLRAIPYDVEAAIADLEAVGYPSVDVIANRYRNGVKS